MTWTISRTNQFKKNYKRLPPTIQTKFKEKFALFVEDFYTKELNTYKLKGKLEPYLSSSITDNYRFITDIDYSNHEIILVNIGTHSIYK